MTKIVEEKKRNMSYFMKANVKPVAEREVVISNRFVDEEGNLVKFVIKPIDTLRMKQLAEDCTEPTKDGEELNYARFQERCVVESTIYPSFKELIHEYNVIDPVDAMYALLCVPGEYTELQTQVNIVNGRDVSLHELVNDAKN